MPTPSSPMPRCNIVITTFNRLELTKRCLDSLLRHTPELGKECELTVVDNASTDGTQEYLHQLYSQGYITRYYQMRRNMGVAVASNLGWASVDADYYVKLDNDIAIHHDKWLHQLLAILDANPSVGAAGYLLCPWHKTELTTLEDGTPFRSFTGLGGGCVAIPRRVHDVLGFWNEDYGTYGFEDLDYGNRIIGTGLLSGYALDDAAISHLGVDTNRDAAIEQRKNAQISSNAAGERLYLLNKFMFEQGLRPIRVERKYHCSTKKGSLYHCSVTPSYKRFMTIQKHLNKHFSFTRHGDKIAIDVDTLKTALEQLS